MRKIKPGQDLERANVLSLFDALYLLKNNMFRNAAKCILSQAECCVQAENVDLW